MIFRLRVSVEGCSLFVFHFIGHRINSFRREPIKGIVKRTVYVFENTISRTSHFFFVSFKFKRFD